MQKLNLNESYFVSCMKENNCVSIIQQNIRSMRKNFDEFVAEISAWKTLPEIIILTEIWISNNESSFYQISNYDLIVHSNENYRSGGVAIYFKNNVFHSLQYTKIQFETADILKTQFKIYGSEFVLYVIYRLHEYCISNFVNELDLYFSNSRTGPFSKNNLILGDINIDLFKSDNDIDRYKTLMASFGFESLINEATRKTEQTETCIDHVYSRVECKDRVSVEAIVIRREITDHYMTAVRLSCGGMRDSSELGDQRTVARLDYAQLIGLLDHTDWALVYNQQDASAAYDLFEGTLLQYVSQSKKEVVVSSKFIKLKPWITDNLCRRIKKRNVLYKKTRNRPLNDPFRNYYVRFRNKLK